VKQSPRKNIEELPFLQKNCLVGNLFSEFEEGLTFYSSWIVKKKLAYVQYVHMWAMIN